MIGWIFAGLVILLALVALHFIQKCTKLEVENENLRQGQKVAKAQLDIAAEPVSSASDLLKRMHSNDL